MSLLKPILLIATTLMIANPGAAAAGEPVQASKRMLEYSYSKMDILFYRDIRSRAPEPRTQQEFETLHKKAEEGNADSNYLLSDLYALETTLNAHYNPDIISESESQRRIKESLHFLLRSLALNPRHPLALNRAGINHEMGVPFPKDMNKAVYYYDLAAQNGNGAAAHHLFEIYMADRDGIPKDVDKARHYAEQAKDLGSNFHRYTTAHWDETVKHYEGLGGGN
ncbi:hypothetical protein LMG26846_03878 [Achromobacter insuavis]|uniref:SEL1-like repeat protein n=1 Tax=Achromobacter insuavis TaxID=1287735 RepID=UPI00146852F1|nr:SEL1-like repeat protein [Achromobacter insuavis]CAB3888589.1 hypothetical protein LMG26846_03878 [Achromobacter insuavis]